MSEKLEKSVAASKSVSTEKSVLGRRTHTSQFKREAVQLIAREGLSVAAGRLGSNQRLSPQPLLCGPGASSDKRGPREQNRYARTSRATAKPVGSPASQPVRYGSSPEPEASAPGANDERRATNDERRILRALTLPAHSAFPRVPVPAGTRRPSKSCFAACRTPGRPDQPPSEWPGHQPA